MGLSDWAEAELRHAGEWLECLVDPARPRSENAQFLSVFLFNEMLPEFGGLILLIAFYFVQDLNLKTLNLRGQNACNAFGGLALDIIVPGQISLRLRIGIISHEDELRKEY